MVSFRASIVLAAMAMFSLGNGLTRYTIDPESVPGTTRENWCQAQMASCPLLCLQNPKANDASTAENNCDSDTLDYNCICGNGIQPDSGNFSQTIPYFLCQEYGNQCVNQCGSGNTPCQSACRNDNPCGAQNPIKVNVTTTSMMPASGPAMATSGPAIFTGLGGDSSSSDSKKSGSQAALSIGNSYGLAVIFAGLFGGFALVL